MNNFFLILLIAFSFSTCSYWLNSSIIHGSGYKLKIYEHPICKMKYCSQLLFKLDSDNFALCAETCPDWQNPGERYSLNEEEALALCVFSRDAKGISNILDKGYSGIFGCFLDPFNSALSKLRTFAKTYNMSTFSYLYTGAELERAKSYNLIDGSQCLLKKGDQITFTSYGSTSSDKKMANTFALEYGDKGGILITIQTLKKKTKAVMIEPFSFNKIEAEYIFPPGSKFEVVSSCEKKFVDDSKKKKKLLYEVEVKEIEELEEMDEYETQEIDPNENKIKKFTKICTGCNDEVHDYCKYCNEKNKCSECYAGYTPNENGKCVKCEENCLKCDYQNKKICKGCYNGFGLLGNQCLKCDNKNCINCDGNQKICQKCKEGYNLISGVCTKKSDTWCKSYNSKGKCSECFGGTYLENSECIECNIDDCSNCLNDSKENSRCTNCFPGFGLENEKCKNCKILGCENCLNNKCIDCENTYIKNNEGKCTKCEDEIDYCKECEFKNNNIQCKSCYKGYILVENKCQRCDYFQCFECKRENGKNICLSCLPGNELNSDGQCKSCENNCFECKYNKDNSQECLFCKNGYYMDKNKKCNKCSDGCEKCSIESGTEKCDLCSIINHYMDSNGKCQKCNNAIEGCERCNSDKNNKVICTKCGNNYALKNGECKKCLIDNCAFCEYDNKEICLRCEGKNSMNMFGIEQYGLKDGQCVECDSESCGKCKLNQEKNVLECEKNNANGLLILKILWIFILLF